MHTASKISIKGYIFQILLSILSKHFTLALHCTEREDSHKKHWKGSHPTSFNNTCIKKLDIYWFLSYRLREPAHHTSILAAFVGAKKVSWLSLSPGRQLSDEAVSVSVPVSGLSLLSAIVFSPAQALAGRGAINHNWQSPVSHSSVKIAPTDIQNHLYHWLNQDSLARS